MKLDNQIWAKEISEKIKKKMRRVGERNQNWIPSLSVNGCYEDMTEKDIKWWTMGCWCGTLWQMYHATGEKV